MKLHIDNPFKLLFKIYDTDWLHKLMVVPEWGVGWFKQGLVPEEGRARCWRFILEVCGDVLGWGAPEDLQPFLQHLLPALQRL